MECQKNVIDAITPEALKEYLEEMLNNDAPEFDEVEDGIVIEDIVPDNNDEGLTEISYFCDKVQTGDFHVTIHEYAVEIDEGAGTLNIKGKARAEYKVFGLLPADGDWDDYVSGFDVVGEEEDSRQFTFFINVNLSDISQSDLSVMVN